MGFLTRQGFEVVADSDVRENTIITVGRIGTQQKNNFELLTAFEKANLQGWTLKFIGAVEPEFQFLVDSYFLSRPALKKKVVFTGAITDKARLYEEYSKAKIFALTSIFEGGTPNVYAEALAHGCMFITSDIDAADDIVNFGKLGAIYKKGDIDALTRVLTEMCSKADNQAFEQHIPFAKMHLRKFFDWQRNTKKLSFLLFGK
jgi:glycosyltransferase involved in cell wall biosynthesis